MIPKKKHKNYKQKRGMCKTNMKTYIYYVNICKHKYEKNMTRLWCKIMFKIDVKHIEGNEGSYLYLYPLRKFLRRFLSMHRVKKLLENFLK